MMSDHVRVFTHRGKKQNRIITSMSVSQEKSALYLFSRDSRVMLTDETMTMTTDRTDDSDAI